MKEVVLKLDYHDDKRKQEAMKTVFGLNGVDSIAMDMKDKKLTMIGDIDPVAVVATLRKVCRNTEMVTFGPAKEPDKKEEPKKEEPKKKVVIKVDFRDDNGKKDAVKKLSGLLDGVDSIAMNMKDKKLTMIGDIDPVVVAAKLRKVCRNTKMVTFGPAKEPDKKEEPKKEESKKKVVLKLDYDDDKRKQEAMKIVFGLDGVDSIEMDMKDKKLTMIGDIDPVAVVDKLRKVCHREIITVTEPDKKKKEPKKEEPKKERKQEGKEPDKKKKEPKKEEPKKEKKPEEVNEPDKKKKEPKKEEPKKERK